MVNIHAVVVTYNSADHIRPCLRSLQEESARIVAVDNGSRDETLKIIQREFPEVHLVAAEKNLGYGPAINSGVTKTSSPLVLLANADTVFPAGAIDAFVNFFAAHPKVGIAGPQQLFPDGSAQRSYGTIPGIAEGFQNLFGITAAKKAIDQLSSRHHPARPAKSVGYVDGAVMVVRRTAFDQVGGFDPDFHYYGEDADLCIRMRQAGWEVVTVPEIYVTHVRGGSSTKVEGYSDALLQALGTARYRLIRKHCPAWHWPLYRVLLLSHYSIMFAIYKSFAYIYSENRSRRASVLAHAYSRWSWILRQIETYH